MTIFILKNVKKVDFHFKKLNSLSTCLTNLSICCGKLLKTTSVMQNNQVVREMLLANGLILSIMKIKKEIN